MQDVSTQDLKNYVSTLRDMYLQKLAQEQAERELATKISALGRPRNFGTEKFEKPTPPKQYLPEKEESEEPSLYINYRYIAFAVGGLIMAYFVAAFALVLVLCGILCFEIEEVETFMNVVMSIWMGFWLLCAVVIIVADYQGEIGAVKQRNLQVRERNANAKKRYDEECVEYKRKLEEYNWEISLHQERISAENHRLSAENIEKAKLSEQLAQLRQEMVESERRLNEMKAVGILYGKYCDIVPILYIHEYLITERCETRKEAYNLYEQESRLDNIANAIQAGFSTMTDLLNAIIGNQQVSVQNQYAIINAIEESNRISARILSKISDRIRHE